MLSGVEMTQEGGWSWAGLGGGLSLCRGWDVVGKRRLKGPEGHAKG